LDVQLKFSDDNNGQHNSIKPKKSSNSVLNNPKGKPNIMAVKSVRNKLFGLEGNPIKPNSKKNEDP